MRFAVAYYRVSTQRQGKSGLGLEAQQESVRLYAKMYNLVIIRECIEIESGKKANRPLLKQALHYCEREQALLVIAKLDRLGRNVAFISSLMESKTDFVAVDNPQASRFVLHMLAAFAEHEREINSARTKDALQAAKRRGVILGKYGKTLAEINRRKADAFAMQLKPVITLLHNSGITTLVGIAAELNKRNISTYRNGARWHKASVFNLLERLRHIQKDYGVTYLV